MESVLLSTCSHIEPLHTQNGLQRIARAAELVQSSANRPLSGIINPSVPKCLHPQCRSLLTKNIHVCVECVHFACMTNYSDHNTKLSTSITHVHDHSIESNHKIFLSVEYCHLFCVECNDYVFDRYLDSAIALQKYFAQADKRKFLSSHNNSQPSTEKAVLNQNKRRLKKRRLHSEQEWIPSEQEMKIIGQNTKLLGSMQRNIMTHLELPVGLFNLGNSCYMNSVLQAFLNAPALRNFFLADLHRPYCTRKTESDCLACAIDRLICDSCFVPDARSNRKEKGNGANSMLIPFLVPHKILNITWRYAGHLATYAQHDAHEFLIAALDILHKHSQRIEHIPLTKPKKESDLIGNNLIDHRRLPQSKSEEIDRIKDVPSANNDEIVEDAPSESEHDQEDIKNIIKTLFSGTLQSDVICRVCSNSSPTLEDFYDIALDVDKLVKPASTRRSRAPSPNTEMGNQRSSRSQLNSTGEEKSFKDKCNLVVDTGTNKGSGIDLLKTTIDSDLHSTHDRKKDLDPYNSIYECLARFTEPELLDTASKMYCSACGCRQEAMKQMSIRTLPAIVCFHFKRFEQSFANTRRSEMVKNETPVEFPVEGLDLSEFRTSKVLQTRSTTTKSNHTTVNMELTSTLGKNLQNSHQNGMEKDQLNCRDPKDATYDLFAIVNHIGKIDSGHYTTNVRRQGIWYKCDDEKVSPIDNVEQTIRSGEAYLLFYAQRYPTFQF